MSDVPEQPKLFELNPCTEYAVRVGLPYEGWHDVSSPPCPACGRRLGSLVRAPCTGTVSFAQKKWPDVLSCVCEVLVSDRVVDDMCSAGITGLRLHEVHLEGVPPGKACPWRYWMIEPLGKARFSVALPEGAEPVACPQCGTWDGQDLAKVPHVGVLPLRLDFWDGVDFVSGQAERNLRSMCSERVVDLARERKWTNIGFRPARTRLHVQFIHYPNWRERLEVQLQRYCSGATWDEVYAPPLPGDPLEAGSESTVKGDEAKDAEEGGSGGEGHIFDTLVDDGYACQGSLDMKAGFGPCGLLVFPDGDDGPSPEQRDLFDDFIASEEDWLPALKRKIEAALAKAAAKGTVALGAAVPESVGQFSDLARWLTSPDISIDEQSGENEGVVGLEYGIRVTDCMLYVKLGPRSEAGKWRIRVGIGVVGETVSDARQREASGEV